MADKEAWLLNVHIPEYLQGTWNNHTPRRRRKLLLKRREIDRLASRVAERGLTIVPLALHFHGDKAKVQIGLGRGKKTYDKRQDLARRALHSRAARAQRGEQNARAALEANPISNRLSCE